MNVGEESNDECYICGIEWTEGTQGWVLCDTDQCPNTVCITCTSALSLSVSELFYCPSCAGSGDSAAAVVGAAVASAVAACVELEKLPLSFKATRRILENLVAKPDEPKYRRLRLENKAVKELIDLEPVLNILTSIGFTKKLCDRSIPHDSDTTTTPKEELLILEGLVPVDRIHDLLEIFDGMSNGVESNKERNCNDDKVTVTDNECGKRKRESIEDTKQT